VVLEIQSGWFDGVLAQGESGGREALRIIGAGAARRSFIIGIRLCPPARSRASGPCRSSNPMASSTEVATS